MTSVNNHKNVWYIQPKFLFAVLTIVNLLNFMDRGIIPGASNEFNSFIEDSMDTSTPDAYLGLLQSAFIVGLVAGSIAFGHGIHLYSRFTLTAIGCSVWAIAVVLSGISYYCNSYIFLVIARMISGVGEASLQVAIPPWIQKTALPKEKGTYLSLFYTAVPVGTAIGYAYSSIVAGSIGWQWAFFIEVAVMLPLILFMFHIAPYFPCEDKHHHSEQDIGKDVNGTSNNSNTESISDIGSVTSEEPVTFLDELLVVNSRTLFIIVSLGYAAQNAVLIGLSTFGSSFFMGMGYFNTESESSSVFGVLVSVAGIIGTPIGGILFDRQIAAAKLRRKQANVWGGLVNGEHRSSGVIEGNDTGSNADKPSDEPTDGNDSHDSLRHRLLAPTTRNVGDTQYTSVCVQEIDDPDLIQSVATTDTNVDDNEDDHIDIRQLKLGAAFKIMTSSIALGMLMMCALYFVQPVYGFFTLLFMGSSLLFLSMPCINVAVMLSVPTENQSLAIAVSIIIMHACGDVPSPIVVGLLKDILAPGCIPNEDDDGDEVSTSEDCRDDAPGLRLCFLLVSMWLFI